MIRVWCVHDRRKGKVYLVTKRSRGKKEVQNGENISGRRFNLHQYLPAHPAATVFTGLDVLASVPLSTHYPLPSPPLVPTSPPPPYHKTLTPGAKGSLTIHLNTFFLLLSCISPANSNSSRMKYAFWKLKIISNSHTFP